MSDDVLAAVRRWMVRARSDWETIRILTEHGDAPPDTVCFHAQQRVEKLIKAILTWHGIEAPRTHDLQTLFELAAPVLPDLQQLADQAKELTPFAVGARYPEAQLTMDSAAARRAVELAESLGNVLLARLPE